MVRDVLSGTALRARRRTVVETLCYRPFMLLIAVIVAWVVGDAADALNIGIVTNLTKTGTYYLYERTRDHVTWDVSNSA